MKKYMGLIIFAVIIVILIIIALMPANDEKYLKDISFTELTTKIDKKESFILYVKRTNCEHCKDFTPKFASVLKDYKITAYVINIADLTEEESVTFEKMTNIEGTPNVFFYENGQKIMIAIDGDVPVEKIKSELKSAGYIK